MPRRSVHAAAAAAGVGVTVLALARWRRVEVRGASMMPTLQPGDRLLVLRGTRVRCGRVVAVRDPRHPARILVKRVAAVDAGSGAVTVVGDNPEASSDSRTFGPVAGTSVLGEVVYRYGPADRAGWVH